MNMFFAGKVWLRSGLVWCRLVHCLFVAMVGAGQGNVDACYGLADVLATL